MYKMVVKDGTVINLKSIETDTDTNMIASLDTEMSHDEAISKFTKDNLSYVKILNDETLLKTYVNLNEIEESSVKKDVITVNISKSDIKDIIINLRKENDTLKNALVEEKAVNEQQDMCIVEAFQQIYANQA